MKYQEECVGIWYAVCGESLSFECSGNEMIEWKEKTMTQSNLINILCINFIQSESTRVPHKNLNKNRK